MSWALFVITSAIIAIVAFVFGYRGAGAAGRPQGGWYGLGILALLFAGLWVAGNSGNEPLAYGFGTALMLVLPVLLAIGIAAAIGSAIRRRRDRG